MENRNEKPVISGVGIDAAKVRLQTGIALVQSYLDTLSLLSDIAVVLYDSAIPGTEDRMLSVFSEMANLTQNISDQLTTLTNTSKLLLKIGTTPVRKVPVLDDDDD